MPTITSFSGEKLLAPATVAEIKNQTEILLKNKDVAFAYQAAIYLKAELAKLPADKVKPVLDVYRAVTANLKVLALPLLEKEEVKNLLANNLPFVDAAFSDSVPASLAAWLALQPEADKEKTKDELFAVLPAGNPLSEKIKAVISSASSLPLVVVSPSVIPAIKPALAKAGAGIQFRRNSLDSGSMAGMTGARDKSGLGVATKKDELFDDDEASELANHAAKVNEMGGNPLSVDGATRLADEILLLRHPSPAATGGSLQTRPEPPEGRRGDDKGQTPELESFKRRAQALIVSRLRDVRTTAEMREYLGRPFAVGGLGLSGDGLDMALKLIEQEYGRLHASGPGKTAAQESRPTASPAPEAGTKSPAEESQGAKGQDAGKVAPSAVSGAATSSVIPNPAQRGEESPLADKPRSLVVPLGGTPRDDKKESPEPSILTPSPLGPRVARPIPTFAAGDKPRLDDIKRPATEIVLPSGSKGQVPLGQLNVGGSNIGVGTGDAGQGGKGQGPRWQSQGNFGSGTVGEPDELKLLTLDDWRKFGGGQAAGNHILEKVNILAKESLSEKIDALAAFHQSPLFREYVTIGQSALSSGRKLAETLADAALNSNKMTEDEFFAVADLNGKLK